MRLFCCIIHFHPIASLYTAILLADVLTASDMRMRENLRHKGNPKNLLYRKTRPIQKNSASMTRIGRVFLHWQSSSFFYKLINKIVINQVISYWPSYRSSVCCIGSQPRTNTADLGPITGQIRNNLINNIIILIGFPTHNKNNIKTI